MSPTNCSPITVVKNTKIKFSQRGVVRLFWSLYFRNSQMLAEHLALKNLKVYFFWPRYKSPDRCIWRESFPLTTVATLHADCSSNVASKQKEDYYSVTQMWKTYVVVCIQVEEQKEQQKWPQRQLLAFFYCYRVHRNFTRCFSRSWEKQSKANKRMDKSECKNS